MESVKVVNLAGKLKVWQSRLGTYISMVNFVMIIVSIGILSIVFIDTKFIMPSALGYTFGKNPRFVRLGKNIELIMCHLGIEDGDVK